MMNPQHNHRRADPHSRLHGIFSHFMNDPGIACRTVDGDLSFAGLHDAALSFLSRLQRLPGAEARPAVMIWGHKNLRYPVAYWACLLGGFPLIPVEPETPSARIRQIAETGDAFALLVADKAERAAGLENTLSTLCVAVLDIPLILGRSEEVAAFGQGIAAPSDTAYVMFSSGTLGQPKGIQVTYANLVDFIDWLDMLLPERVLHAISGNIRYCFDVSLFEIWVSWTRKLPLTVLDHGDFADSTGYIGRLAKDGVGLWVSTPSITRLILRNSRFNGTNLPHLKTFVFCGEALGKPIVGELFRRFPGCRVLNTYGPTECTVAVTSVEITQDHLDAEGDLPIGYARPSAKLNVAGDGANGEILVSGPCVGRGYLKLPEKQEKAFPETGLYRTGDWGYVNSDGLWFFHGRMDREIKVQGVRIDLNDVEAHIRRQPGIEDVVVAPHILRGEARSLNAYVIGAADENVLKRLAETLESELPPYLVPRFWYAGFTTALNNNSKIDRDRLQEAGNTAAFRHVHAYSGIPTAPIS